MTHDARRARLDAACRFVYPDCVRLTGLLTVFALAGATCYARVAPSVLLGYRGEPGVESKMVVTTLADIAPVQFLKVDAGLSFNLFRHNGLGAAGMGIGAVVFSPAGLTFRLAAQHQQWNDWKAGENRALGTIEAGPVFGVEAGFGIAWRVPVFGDECWSPFVWHSDASEWNYVYRLTWRFIDRENWWLTGGFSSYDLLTVHNPQQFPLTVSGACRLRDNLELVGDAGTAIVGYSGGLASFHELTLNVGVKYDF
jgi:hypothetical protein